MNWFFTISELRWLKSIIINIINIHTPELQIHTAGCHHRLTAQLHLQHFWKEASPQIYFHIIIWYDKIISTAKIPLNPVLCHSPRILLWELSRNPHSQSTVCMEKLPILNFLVPYDYVYRSKEQSLVFHMHIHTTDDHFHGFIDPLLHGSADVLPIKCKMHKF